MGGLGSGNFTGKKEIVENCLCLDINEIARMGLLKGKYAREMFCWTCSNSGKELYRVELEVMNHGKNVKHLSISHISPENNVSVIYDQHLWLESTVLESGGKRWWFSCPGTDGHKGNCSGRVAKLYLESGKHDFACRKCHDLTYKSCSTGLSTLKVTSLCQWTNIT